MKRCNDRNALRKLRWKVPENFTERKKKTWLVHLTYSDDFLPEYDEDAQKALTNYIERLNRRQRQKYKEAMEKDHHNPGGVLRKVKYIAVTEFQHADEEKGLKEVRYHHHMILECDLSIDEIKDLWVTRCGKDWVEPLGLVKADRAEFDKGGLDAYCEYITKYEGKRTHKWRQSKVPADADAAEAERYAVHAAQAGRGSNAVHRRQEILGGSLRRAEAGAWRGAAVCFCGGRSRGLTRSRRNGM